MTQGWHKHFVFLHILFLSWPCNFVLTWVLLFPTFGQWGFQVTPVKFIGTAQRWYRLHSFIHICGQTNHHIWSPKKPNTWSKIIQHQQDTMYIPLQRNCVEKTPHGYSSLHSDVPHNVPQGYSPTHHLPLDHHGLQWYQGSTGENFFLDVVQCHYVDFMLMSCSLDYV